MRTDLFCRVVDNYGDIGVCWRLARRLAHGRGWPMRLWVDDLDAFSRIQPDVRPGLARQEVAGIDVVHWTPQPDPALLNPAEVVIEAFACDPPADYVAAMQRTRPIWINLEYLSAEPWIESCHGLPSRRPDGLVKYFFFPGFTPATGGLLREPGLSAERDALQASVGGRQDFLRTLGLGQDDVAPLAGGARLATLFCYPHAPWAELAAALSADAAHTLLLVPQGVAPGLEAAVSPGGRLRMARVPFVIQHDFDRLLWCADINFVRGEDSFVRAAWAARPLVWQIYPQDEDVHLEKLAAWQARYAGPEAAQALVRAWNADSAAVPQALARALAPPAWNAWQQTARQWDADLAARPDLADNLADFCAELANTR
ncbi:elongation factor P maturation arginine rhamnosyltransferase EarP [Bordetella genomosp. 13]|uniref:elongation factor P maturation arginine rhamnosyltransferase EarP n=1 Tax=Bordetella genomosp. 13 TaxID=463040 RepID=UPI0011A2B99E|nr:elongation factor P maturation arginine rhamnosyltransferase EarP [Bordetella genomosp. 13]